MKKNILLFVIVMMANAVCAQTTAWIKQLNEEAGHLSAGSTRYYTASKTPYASTTYTIRQFNSSGTNLLSTTVFPGSPYTSMDIIKILATPSNELYVLGYAFFSGGSHGMLFKLSSSCLQLWQRPLPAGTGLSSPLPVDLAIKGSDIIVVMRSVAPGSVFRAELRTVSQSTGAITISRATGTIHNNLLPTAIAVDGSQNVYVCGQLGTTNGMLLKYNSGLTQQWSRTFSRGHTTWFSNLVLDVLGNCYVAGAGSPAQFTGYQTIVRKYNGSGVFQSGFISSTLPSSNYYPWVGFKIKITPGGELFVATASMASQQPRIMAYKFSSANLGTPLYDVTHLLPLSHWNFNMTGFEVSQGGKAFLVGKNVGTSNVSNNYVTAKIRANGTVEFFEVLNGGRCNAVIKAIPGTYPNDDFVTAGVVGNINMLIKYTGPGLRIGEEESTSTFSLYPNPATSEITIVSDENASQVFIYDLQGKLMLSESISGVRLYPVGDLPRGIYLVKVINEDGTGKTQKLILQ
jgi:hypothetical protein